MSNGNIADALGMPGHSIADALGMPGHSIAEAVEKAGANSGGDMDFEVEVSTSFVMSVGSILPPGFIPARWNVHQYVLRIECESDDQLSLPITAVAVSNATGITLYSAGENYVGRSAICIYNIAGSITSLGASTLEGKTCHIRAIKFY